MKHWIAWPAKLTSYLVFHAPRRLQAFAGAVIGTLWFDVFRLRRRVAIENVGVAFPELPPRARARIARRSLWHLGRCLVEYAYLPWLDPRNYRRFFIFENTEVLRAALDRGHGVLVLTCHIGNGDLGCAGLSLEGLPMTMVSKTFKTRWLNDLWFGMRRKLGTEFVGARDSSFALLKALKRGRAVVIPLDQFTGPPIGARTTFFGRETGTALGLAVMAQRSRAPVVPIFTTRRPDGRHVIRVLPEIERRDETPEALTQRFNDVLEAIVRVEPAQWMWIHRRWKRFKY